MCSAKRHVRFTPESGHWLSLSRRSTSTGPLIWGSFGSRPLAAKLNHVFSLQIEALTGDDPIGLGIDEREATEVINTVRKDRVTSARGPSVAACKRR
jgi:hypothetical protein